jgi:hypothetical protein
MTAYEHAIKGRRLRILAGNLMRRREDLNSLPQNGIPAEALECIARAKDELAIARDHVEREAREHEREALRLEREG